MRKLTDSAGIVDRHARVQLHLKNTSISRALRGIVDGAKSSPSYPCFQQGIFSSSVALVGVALGICDEVIECFLFCRAVFLQQTLERNDYASIADGRKVGRLGQIGQGACWGRKASKGRGGRTVAKGPPSGDCRLCLLGHDANGIGKRSRSQSAVANQALVVPAR